MTIYYCHNQIEKSFESNVKNCNCGSKRWRVEGSYFWDRCLSMILWEIIDKIWYRNRSVFCQSSQKRTSDVRHPPPTNIFCRILKRQVLACHVLSWKGMQLAFFNMHTTSMLQNCRALEPLLPWYQHTFLLHLPIFYKSNWGKNHTTFQEHEWVNTWWCSFSTHGPSCELEEWRWCLYYGGSYGHRRSWYFI